MIKKLLALSSVALLAVATAAHADTIFSNSPSTYVGVECCFSVDLHQVTADEMQVTVTLIDGATFFAHTGSGDHPGFAFNLAGDPSVTLSGYNTTDWTGSTSPVTTNGPSLGSFDYQFNLNSNGVSGGITSLVFDVTGTSAITPASFVANSDGVQFVADILGSNGGTGLSGITGPGQNFTPEPSSLLLLGTGIIGAAGMVRRKMAGLR